MIDERFIAIGMESNPHSGFAIGYAVDEEGVVTTLPDFSGDQEAVREKLVGLTEGDSGVVFEGEFHHIMPEKNINL